MNLRTFNIKPYFGFIFILFITFIPLLDLLNPGVPQTHDGIDHVARIANFYQSLSEGNIVPRWGANLNWGFGHPVIMFLYPLSSYVASVFHIIGFSFEESVKLVFAIAYILSGLTMYIWARNQFDEYIGILAAVLYLFAPYRFIDLYVRGAIGEHVAFIFPPLILYFLYKFFNQKKNISHNYIYFLGISFSMALLILGHNAISIMFLPVIILYILYQFFLKRNKTILFLSISALIYGFLLSAFFLIPAFIEGKYTLRDIVTGDEYKTRFIEPLRLLYGNWNYGITGQFSIQLGIVHILGLLLFPALLLKLKKERKTKLIILMLGSLFIFLLSIFIMLPQSNFLYEIFTTLKKFQFPWRFLSLTTFASSIIAAAAIYIIGNEQYKKIVLLGVVFSVLFISKDFYQAKGYFSNSDDFYKKIYKSTTDTGESSPIWSVRFMEKIPKEKVEVIEGVARVVQTKRDSTNHSYIISANSDKARIKDNTVYFPGWKVFANNRELPIEFQDQNHRGLITFFLPKGDSVVEVVFKNTKVRTISNVISVISVILIFTLVPIALKRKNA